MKSKNLIFKPPREVSLIIWKNIFYENRNLTLEIEHNKYFKLLNRQDKAFTYNLINMCIRRNVEIKKIYSRHLNKKIVKHHKYLTSILMLGTTEIYLLRTPNYAVLNDYVELTKTLIGKHYTGFVNAVLRKVIDNKHLNKISDEDFYLNIPKFMFSKWIKSYGKNTANSIAKEIMKKPYVDIICSKKISVIQKQKLISDIKGLEIYPNVIRSFYKGPINSIKGYKDGVWWIQDLGSYIQFEILFKKIKNLFQVKSLSNINILDLCAAPGGKTIQILDKGLNVLSVDKNIIKINIMKNNLDRMNFDSHIICEDASKIKFNKFFDVILIDAPCSSTGTIRKNPDILLRKNDTNYESLLKTQMKILKNASKFLKNNGLLMYIVCSLEKIEGQKIIKHFCKQNNNFKIEPIFEFEINLRKKRFCTSNGLLQILPDTFYFPENRSLDGSSGFFSSIIRKVKI